MLKKVFCGIFVCLLVTFPALAKEIIVAAAANVQFPLRELKAVFEQDNPGTTVKTVLGSSGKLTAQIENGAPFHVFLSADTQYPQAVFNQGLAAAEPKVYAYGTLVLWTMGDFDLSAGINILKDPSVKTIALADPEAAPYGRQAVNALKAAAVYDDIAGKLVYGESITQVNQFIAGKAADVGFTAKSVVLAPNLQDKGKWIEIDPTSYSPIAQGAVLLKYGIEHNRESSQKFYDFIFSDKAGAIFKKYGYILP